ncbi:MAG: hypothetical protein M0002_08330 [Rhodospirillales bacterium]|nr:hypothetical protein [Rhodospirillales bacterium]
MTLTGALSGILVSLLYNGRTPSAMTGVMAGFPLAALAAPAGFVRPPKRRPQPGASPARAVAE